MIQKLVRRVLSPLVILALAGICAATTVGQEVGTTRLRVGTFDTRCVAFAYGQTKGPGSFFARVQELKRQYAEAEKAGDDATMAELQEAGESLQHQMHLKVFCGTPIDDILAHIQDKIPTAAEAAGVDLIVQDVPYVGDAVELVDVTAEMARLFTTDPKVIAAIPEILATPVVDAEEFEKGRHEH